MRAVLLAAAALAGLTTAAFAAGDTDPFMYFTKDQAFATVAVPKADGSATSNIVSNHDDFSASIVQRTVSGKAETHEFYTDYLVVVEGTARIAIGGKVNGNAKNPNGAAGEWLGASITGGKTYDFKPGTMIVIPKGVPHQMLLPANGKLHYLAFKRKG
jgi:mannose-6-phosphate isomerase-like protein (cupin superfamily)